VKKILVIDDEKLIRWSLKRDLEKSGFEVSQAESAEEGMRMVREHGPDLVLLDFRLPGRSGLELLPDIKQYDEGIQVILMSAHGGVETAVKAMKAGAFHYVHKPFNRDELHLMIAKALENAELRNQLLNARLQGERGLDDFMGESDAIQGTRTLARKVADSPAATILLTGESGTGKDLLAKIIHALSDRRDHPFLTINCSALPDNLLESELFGFEAGAFTDARQAKRGLFEEAARGTVYLDEIGDMVPALQAKLLSVIETRQFRPLGATKEVAMDARIIAATNRDLKAAVDAGSFREDLFYRLNVLPIDIPPLRDRGDDVQLLASHFLREFARDYRRPMHDFTSGARKALAQHGWPGNVRELRNAIERLVILEQVEIVDVNHLPHEVVGGAASEAAIGLKLPPEGLSLEALEEDLIRQAMAQTGGNQTRAAQLLGLSRDALRYRLGKLRSADTPENG